MAAARISTVIEGEADSEPRGGTLRNVLGPYQDSFSDEEPIVHGSNLRFSKSVYSDVFLDEPEAEALAQYDDFHTIDWVRDRQRDRIRYRRMKKMKHGTLWDKIKQANDAWAGWLVVFLVGLAAGFFAGIIDIGASWMSDLKEGICPENFWFNKVSCCWSDDSTYDENGCQQWKTWAQLVSNSDINSNGSYVLNYLFYVLISVLMAGTAVLLVRWFAPYACGSGIPEVRS
mgnify:CR=1 FL=1